MKFCDKNQAKENVAKQSYQHSQYSYQTPFLAVLGEDNPFREKNKTNSRY